MEPRTRTVEVEGREAGEKACRCEGRMRGVARDILNLGSGNRTGSVEDGVEEG
jgi:hypothetical protein